MTVFASVRLADDFFIKANPIPCATKKNKDTYLNFALSPKRMQHSANFRSATKSLPARTDVKDPL